GDFDKAREIYLELLEYLQQFKNLSELGKLYNNIARIENKVGNFREGVNNLIKALKCFDEAGDQESKAIAYLNLGGNYAKRGEFENALTYHKKALATSLQYGGVYLGNIYE